MWVAPVPATRLSLSRHIPHSRRSRTPASTIHPPESVILRFPPPAHPLSYSAGFWLKSQIRATAAMVLCGVRCVLRPRSPQVVRAPPLPGVKHTCTYMGGEITRHLRGRSGALATRRAGQKSSWTADLRITKPDLRITSITQHAADPQVASASGAVPARSSRGPSIPRARARFSSTADAHSTRARTNKTQDTQNTHLTPSEGGVAHTSRITRTQMGARSSSLKVCALHYEPLLVPTRVPPGPLRTSYRFFI